MSEHLKKSLRGTPPKPMVWCLPKEDWNQFAAHLMAAEKLFKKAEAVKPEEWVEWTSEFGESQGFPSIIYHDKPVIIRPPELPLS